MRHARLPARVREADSETAYMTDRAIAFVEAMGQAPWCLHLSYIKPHWPYIAPAPYHALYGPEHCQAVHASPVELDDPHPVYAAYTRHPESVSFSRPEVRENVIPTYMGLIRQIDDHLGRLFRVLEEQGRFEDTLIVFTSDHGDYLGDHWLGEKELFHEESVRVPLVAYDPDPAADGTRGTVETRLVEGIDLAPTFVEALGGAAPDHVLEGRSLLPALRGAEGSARAGGRDAVFSELDYAFRPARRKLGVPVDAARAYMVRTEDWKYVFYEGGFAPQLFDLKGEPDEFVDRGRDPALARTRAELHERLFEWLRTRRMRITLPNDSVDARMDRIRAGGIRIGEW